jgi:BTB/POZ domain-containing protein KCTD9
MNYKDRIKNLKEYIIAIPEKPLLTSFLVLIFIALLVIGLSLPYYISNFGEFYMQVLAEAHGMIFDIAVIGILIFWLNKSGEKRLRIKTYKDEIDDFRLWTSEEAAFRTVGNIKRLNRNKIYELNLVDCFLAKTNLNYAILEESNLNNANLSHAKLIECNLQNARLNQTNLEYANLNQAKLYSAYASGANFKDAFLIKANFEKAFLIKANFSNAHMMETNLNGAYLNGANFDNANLYKADLRNTIGLTIEQFEKVKTLYLAHLDEDFKNLILREYPRLLRG